MKFKIKEVEFESPFTNSEAIHILVDLSNKFAASLVANYKRYGGLSDKQWAWVHKLACDAKRPKDEEPERKEIEIKNWSRVEMLFAVASCNLKYPKIRFVIDEKNVVLALAGKRSKFPGSINITDGRKFGENIWYGRVVKGMLTPSRHMTGEIVEFLDTFADSPQEIAMKYGRRTGNCCFCGKTLTTAESTSKGYGPECAKHYGLPWGFDESRKERFLEEIALYHKLHGEK